MKNTRRVIALGFFDGVHKGHGALLRRVTERAAQLDAVPAAFTFDAHPESVILGRATPLLSTPEDRRYLMTTLYGIRDVLVAHYDRAMMQTPWEEFITRYLVAQYGAVHVVVGHDFRFGYRGEGTPDRLAQKCRQLGLGCDIIQPVVQDGITISSTYIRTLVAQGEMERACSFLGHPHTLTRTVIHGKGLGSKLGFPTVNLTVPDGVIVPAHGVYATRIFADGRGYAAVTNVGCRPTVDDGDALTVEGFLLDFTGDLYDRQLVVEFYRHLRPERKFESLQALHDEVMHNARQTRAYFAQLN
ncbi:MAG: riboflavin biosynthesis protein RibF [Oscillospiraceae bacterium]|nr:riboflavin biosynthesis protein RibF [Oscillospiraceae bacterium]